MTAPAGGILGHYCTCGHPATGPWHRPVRHPGRLTGTIPGPCQVHGCGCQLASPQPESVVIPAYDNATGERLGYVIGPGETAGDMRSHACDRCRELWLTCTPKPDPDVDDLFGGAV